MFGELPDPLLAVTTVQQLRPVTQSPYRHTIKTIPCPAWP